MIPHVILSKMDNYTVEIHGVNVKVSVVDDATRIDEIISEMRGSLEPVMGLDTKMTGRRHGIASMLLLCSQGRCLIIPKLPNLFDFYSKSIDSKLSLLFANRTICFLGMELEKKIRLWPWDLRRHMTNQGVGLGNFAARILKKSNLETAELPELAAEVGIDIKPLRGACPDWNARVFSPEGIKHAIHDVYTSYLIGQKLLGML